MTTRARTTIAWTIAVVAIAATLANVALAVIFGWTDADPLLQVTVVLAVVAWGVVGALIASRTGNAVGWALLLVIGLFAITFVTQIYATVSIVELDRRLPLDVGAALLTQVSFILGLAAIVAVPLLYPTGHARWRWVWRLYLSALAVIAIGWLLLPQEVQVAVEGPVLQNPIAVDTYKDAIGAALSVAGFVTLICAGLAVLALILRYREAEGDVRQQIRWLAWVGVVGLAALLVVFALSGLWGDPPPPGWRSFVANALFAIMTWSIVFGIPIACGIAILKYRLYDLDVVIKKTLVALVLAIMLGAIGLAAVFVAGQPALWEATPRAVSVGIGIALGLLVMPLLRLSRRVADRIVYGRRATPYEVLASFSSRVGETYSSDDVLPRMAQILVAGTGAASARVLVRVGDELREAAASGDTTGDEHREPIIFQGEDVGALAVTFPANDPIDHEREQLIANLAAQAGPVVRNVRLLEELRASRQRLVAAQDEERRKIERNLHDGVQQQLVALNVQLGLLAKVAEREPAKAGEMATGLQTRATEALEDLRDLARGIYPPLLADKGLAAALEAQARKAAVPTTVEAEGVGRYDRAIEAAVYFCTLEALNNIAKYANATAATVTLAQTDGRLTFSVTDDGDGFDTSTTSYGTGLQGMADRLDAIGGSFEVISGSDRGTTVTGAIPLGRTP